MYFVLIVLILAVTVALMGVACFAYVAIYDQQLTLARTVEAWAIAGGCFGCAALATWAISMWPGF